MKHLFIVTFFFISSVRAQENLSVYKHIVDKRIKEVINIGKANSLTVANIFLMTDSAGNGQLLKYPQNRNKRVNFEKAIFTCALHKDDLNYTFRFTIRFTKPNTIEFDSSELSHLPPCVLKNTRCNFISKDSAERIARRDSFIASGCSIDLIKERKRNSFYWYMVAKPKQDSPGKDTGNGSQSCRVIDAVTGSIISRARSWVPAR